ncbi:putative tubulin-specific chaperone cofactor E-like protein [Apostichopus japonicus]|uniref:Putative tubulin-specific chaperone cofactor E-like protein n=1 Tax=Stichopus japonicus TaxID=307972 RepID=A0A2G8JXJ5_STIJA|nr:putative tubulin-specific chaperone cofactor E-like protein [Apostichopus japonicus]
MVTSWSEIAKLGQLFPNVENLLLVNNPLSGLTEDIGGHFACLKQLSTLDTKLSSWEDIDNFNHFPKLTELQLRGIPLLKKLKEKESRQLVVARLPHVTKLNNSPISEPEREDAERAFIRKFMDSTEKPKRYEELSSVHKNVHRLAQVDMTVVTSATITIKYKEKTDTMTISTEQTCKQLKKTLASHFGVRRSNIRLLYWSAKGDSEIDVLDPRTTSLKWYNIRDGDEITLEESEPQEVTRAMNANPKTPSFTTFAEAFIAKYLTEGEMASVASYTSILFIPSSSEGKARGEEKDRKSHYDMKQIILSHKYLIAAGDCQEIADKLQVVTELDVSHNALCCWTGVEEIIKFMPNLVHLNLTSTNLSVVYADEEAAQRKQQFKSIKTAILSDTLLKWPYLLSALSGLPCLEELHFGTNNLASIPTPIDETCFTSVRKFYLNRNLLSKWSEIATLGKLFPSIESLHLEKNPLSGLTEDIGRHFACLRQLDITDINLLTWEELDNLNHFPNLEDVKLRGIPLLEEFDEKESRELLIARLPKIRKLNNSSIFELERDCAERAFIEKYADIPEKPTRYDELLAIHHVEAN